MNETHLSTSHWIGEVAVLLDDTFNFFQEMFLRFWLPPVMYIAIEIKKATEMIKPMCYFVANYASDRSKIQISWRYIKSKSIKKLNEPSQVSSIETFERNVEQNGEMCQPNGQP